jgi:hypothetical protein
VLLFAIYMFSFELKYHHSNEFTYELADQINILTNAMGEVSNGEIEIDHIEEEQLREILQILEELNPQNQVLIESIDGFKDSFYTLQSEKLNSIYKS